MQFAKMIAEQEGLKWRAGYLPADAKKIEARYLARLVAEEIRPRGLPAEIMPANHPFDLLVAGRQCEVKIARARRHTKTAELYQGNLRDPDKRRHLDGEIVILVCVDHDDRIWSFVIPRLLVGNRRTVEITSRPDRYGGQWAPFLGAWDYITNHKGG